MDWYENEYMPRVGKRGAEIIEARGASSAASAANAAIDHMHDWVQGADGLRSMAVPSGGAVRRRRGAHLLVPGPLPAAASYEIVEGLEVGEFAQSKIDITVDELKGERDAVKELGWALGGPERAATGRRYAASFGVPAAALLGDQAVLGQAGQHAVEVVLLDPHRLGELGDRDPGPRAHELERLLGARAAAARAAAACRCPSPRLAGRAPARAWPCAGRLGAVGSPPRPERLTAASRRWYSSTSGRSSFRRVSISRFLSSRKSAIAENPFHGFTKRDNDTFYNLSQNFHAGTGERSSLGPPLYQRNLERPFRRQRVTPCRSHRSSSAGSRLGLALGHAAHERPAGGRAQRAQRRLELVAVVEARAAVDRPRGGTRSRPASAPGPRPFHTARLGRLLDSSSHLTWKLTWWMQSTCSIVCRSG